MIYSDSDGTKPPFELVLATRTGASQLESRFLLSSMRPQRRASFGRTARRARSYAFVRILANALDGTSS
jgi:hypothetical protein